ncbi:MAG: tetratricopeptide repeat protein [Candidatus Sericytochromatia bacterium]|nr:tetratricopeptide repeat protein [Candidatus Sericytochromatia bacterium]
MPFRTTPAPQRESLQQLAQSQQALGQWKQAVKSWQTLLKAFPGDVPALLGLVRSYLQLGKRRAAQKYLSLLLQAEPQHPEAALLSAELQPQAALEILLPAVAVHPLHPELLAAIARACGAAGRHEEAVFYWRQMLSLSPDQAQAWLALARLLLQQGELAEAAEAFDKAVVCDPRLRNDARWLDLDAGWQALEQRLSAQAEQLELSALLNQPQNQEN